LNGWQVTPPSKIRDDQIDAPQILPVSWGVAFEEPEIGKTLAAASKNPIRSLGWDAAQ
jgi:hypothetical protein